MATNTYVALDKATVSGSSTTTVTFTVPSGYTDLFIVTSARNSTSGGTDYYMRFNSDTASNYSYTQMIGNGSSAASDRASSAAQFNIGYVAGTSGTAPTICRINVQNYSNTNTYKSILYNWNSQGADAKYILQGVGLWRKTPEAITSISIYTTSGNIVAGSTFSLYGIQAEGVSPAVKATGGAVYSDELYYYHVFGSTGTFTPLSSLTADVLVVAGGGGGGTIVGGGGGAGGLLQYTSQSLTATGYTCTVGAGGPGRSSASGYGAATNGGNSQFGALTAAVGGGAGAGVSANPNSGGSGGGTGRSDVYTTPGSGTSGQGYAGGVNVSGTQYQGAGGGGAGAVGTNATVTQYAGAGGIGATSSFINAIGAATGIGQLVSSNYYFAGGGGGGTATSGAVNGMQGAGGSGGGGAGGYSNNTTQAGVDAISGTANTGGGGGGSRNDFTTVSSGSGGSGVVIVRYLKA